MRYFVLSRCAARTCRPHARRCAGGEATYPLDFAELHLEDVDFDEKAKLVRVKLPSLKIGDVAFRPERARQINGGLLTLSDQVVQELTQTNYRTARAAFIKQAQQTEVVKAAKTQAEQSTQKYFEIPLRIVGAPDIAVRAYFPDANSASQPRKADN